MKHAFLYCLLAIFTKSLFGQDLLVLQPGPLDGIDAFLSSLDADLNDGNHISFYAKAGTRDGDIVIGRSLIKFDLSKLDKSWTIINAYLDLSYSFEDNSNPPHRGDNSSFLIPVTSPWEEDKVTWNTRPNIDMTNAVKLRASNYETESYYDIDVTNLVKLGVSDPSTYFGWMLMLEHEDLYTDIKFASSDTQTPGLRPKLRIFYQKTTAADNQKLNPAFTIKRINDKLEIEFNEVFDNLSIFNPEGKNISNANLKGLKNYDLNLSTFQKGIYFLVLQGPRSSKAFKIMN